MVIGLYGIQGVYNFGCEAIVRGTCRFLEKVFPNSEIIYFSYAYSYDSNALRDLNIKIYPVRRIKSTKKRIVNKLLRIFGKEKQLLMIDALSIINRVDIIISIGGDIYTIPEVIRRQQKYPYYNALVDFCDMAIRHNKNVIAYGASVGPWGENKKAIDYYKKALKKYTAIICREELSVQYLRKMAFDNVLFFPDPAFLLRSDNEIVEKTYIGVNLSPLAFDEVYGNHDEKFAIKLAKMLDIISERYEMKFIFLPHVLSNQEKDNDLIFLNKIREKMCYADNVIFADYGRGFYGIKDGIKKCKFIIASRMHCAINACEECIPAIFISYSSKSIGMAKYIYGNEDLVVPVNRINEKLLDTVDYIIKSEEKIADILKSKNEEILDFYNSDTGQLKQMIMNIS